jgi:hypothetical protein
VRGRGPDHDGADDVEERDHALKLLQCAPPGYGCRR